MRKMIYTTLMFLLLPTTYVFGQFPLTPVQWPTPVGGNNYEESGVSSVYGFPNTSAYNGTNTFGAQTWQLMDMNGDGKPDLLITGFVDSANHNTLTQFNANGSPYWMVYLNTGSQFSSTATQWSTPVGGFNFEINGVAHTNGFNYTQSPYINGDYGAQTWSLFDINGDGKPDLVVTSYIDSANGGKPVQFGATGNPFWRVYLNTGTGFANTATNWPTPVGGDDGEANGRVVTYGFYKPEGNDGSEFNSQMWNTMDINGDGKPDLIINGIIDSANNRMATQYGALINNPYWLVYLNTGTGFADTAITWQTPVGGGNFEFHGTNTVYGFWATDAGYSGSAYGATSWAMHDMDGDGKPDLVLTAVLDSSNLGFASQFAVGSNPYWLVYLNTGAGFASTANTWPTPVGGSTYLVAGQLLDLGFSSFRGFSGPANRGAQTWNVLDIDGDGKLDLVVSGYIDSIRSGNQQFSADSLPYWKVYLNTGTAFSSTETVWSTPIGGFDFDTAGLASPKKGFNDIAAYYQTGHYYGAQSWSTLDMNGDGKPDLVVTAVIDSANNDFATQFGASGSPYWNVYLNGENTGLHEVNLNAQCVIYPNPNNGNFTIQFTDAAERSIEVYDVTGRQLSLPVKMQSRQQFSLEAISAGIYFLRITQNDEVKSLKFVVEK